MSDDLTAIGFNDRWAALLGEHGDAAEPGRVLRHDGVAVQVATPAGERIVKLRRGVEPLTVGDWLALDGESVLGLLDRASLLRRRAAGGDDHQLLAANLDLVLLVCGLDRPVTAGRIQRGEALAWDAGAHPMLVLTKADLADDLDGRSVADRRRAAPRPRAPRRVVGHRARHRRRCARRLARPHLGDARRVRRRQVEARERRARHRRRRRRAPCATAIARVATPPRTASSTCSPGGGVVIDSPGIREVGLAGDEESVDATFADIDELGEECYFADCGHAGEPGCAIALALEAGELSPDRLAGLPGRSARRRPRRPAAPTSTRAAPTSAASRRP